jgi:hypothetical protein
MCFIYRGSDLNSMAGAVDSHLSRILRASFLTFFGGYMFKLFSRLGMVVLASIFYMQPAMAARNVTIDVNPDNSSVNYGTVGVNAVYQYTRHDGEQVNDTIPVQICMTGSDPNWTSIDISFGSPSGGLPGVTPPADQTFYQSATTPDCRNLSILIATGPLNLSDPNVTQQFNANFSLADIKPDPDNGSNMPKASFVDYRNIHIQVTVLPKESTSHVSCYMTDSEGNFLADCDGNPVTVSGTDDGRFVIVTNKKSIEVATNPGQFYYNLVWLNTTGSTQVVDAGFERTGVDPNGTNALHAMVFYGDLSSLTPAEFAQANADGIPEGADDAVNGVEVPDGSTLLVTYHLVWNGLGATVPYDCATNCPDANQLISVTGTVSGTGISPEDCTAGARGYRKK